VTSVIVRKYVLRMRNQKSRDRKRHCPEVAMSRSGPDRSRFRSLRVLRHFRLRMRTSKGTPKGSSDLRSHLVAMLLLLRKKPSGFPCVCACATGSCATPVMTEGHVTPSEVSLGCSLRRPRPITRGNLRVLYLAWLLELNLVICRTS
jgi:hypothetical protein